METVVLEFSYTWGYVGVDCLPGGLSRDTGSFAYWLRRILYQKNLQSFIKHPEKTAQSFGFRAKLEERKLSSSQPNRSNQFVSKVPIGQIVFE
uniref:Uncharacterized protein n=1 Tax=Araneus ventricosus TaxID=182803 RepID=A0A4Y1ZKV5_ARAVE|nr:hypothetical protein AVEN_197627-1 [Araneus ventricosus]GBL55614.1 hypothetical protein AVEN_185605-1 [Araneus ventricosus]